MNLAVTAQHLLPKRLLTQLAGWLARRPGPHAPFLIRRFIARYKVDMSEAANPDIASYATFNDFFARALREGARPLAQEYARKLPLATVRLGPRGIANQIHLGARKADLDTAYLRAFIEQARAMSKELPQEPPLHPLTKI